MGKGGVVQTKSRGNFGGHTVSKIGSFLATQIVLVLVLALRPRSRIGRIRSKPEDEYEDEAEPGRRR